MKILFHSIGELYTDPHYLVKPLRGKELAYTAILKNAWLVIDEGLIQDFGAGTIPVDLNFNEQVDCSGRIIFPAYIDSHTHIVFAATREMEFTDRISGMTYEEIGKRGGGILNSARKLQACTEDELFEAAFERAIQQIKQGTGALEIKSGYGLTVKDELKMLRVIARLKEKLPVPVKSSFLGAHAYPSEFKENHEGYIRLIIDEMLPNIAAEKLADYIDVFCDRGYFNPDETGRILKAGAKYGLKPKIHANELDVSGGVQAGVNHNALTVDHLEQVGENEIKILSQSSTLATVLPGTSFFLGIPYAPARRLVDAGAALCLASDYNPGSSPNGRMSFILSLACIKMKLLPEEALNAATINAACAIELQDNYGSIAKGKSAGFIVSKPVTSLAVIPYTFGMDLIESVYIKGKKVT
jgi:imidazolonepropionase